jgi:hypothetical protein
MIIPIDDDTRIRGTSICWQYERIETRKGQREWRAQKYFSSLRGALECAVEREIRTHPAHGIAECLNAAKQATAKYAELFDQAVKDHE